MVMVVIVLKVILVMVVVMVMVTCTLKAEGGQFHEIGHHHYLHCHLLEKVGSILPREEQGLDQQQKLGGSGEGGQRWPDSPAFNYYQTTKASAS